MQNGGSKSVVDDRHQSFKFDLSKSMETAVKSCEEVVPKPELPRHGENGVFGRFAFQSIAGSQPKRDSPDKDPLDPAEFRRLCSTPRLGSVKHRPPAFHQSPFQKPLQLRSESPATESPIGKKRPRPRQQTSNEENDDDFGISLEDTPLPVNKQPMRRLVRAGQGLKRNSSMERSVEPGAKNGKGSVSSGFDFDTEQRPKPPPKEPEMRMRVDPKRFYGPKMVDLEEVGEVLEEDAVDEVLKQCEGISDKLRKALGSEEGGGYKSLEGGAGMATPEVLSKACGSAAKYIKSYQLIGINFLLLLAKEGVEGSILADEMGLGKTAQTICFLGCLKEMFQDPGPHLVICPASLLENWQRELERWCPSLNVVAYYGPNRSDMRHGLDAQRRAAIGGEPGPVAAADVVPDTDDELGDESEEKSESDSDFEGDDSETPNASRRKSHGQASPMTCDPSQLPFNVMLTCYTLFERDSAEQRLDRKFLKDWNWSHLILDEAHAVKNSSAMRTVRLNKVAERCKRRVMLTGTPLQNDLEELQNLLRFLMPKLFTAEEAAELQNVQDEQEMGRLAERMQGLLRPFVLRRLKTEVANQLMPKQHQLHKVPMTPEQAKLYADAVAELKNSINSVAPSADSLLGAASKMESSQDAEKRKAEAAKLVKKMGQKKVGNAFVVLRKVALHPLLVRRLFSDKQVEEIARTASRRGLFGAQATEAKVMKELLSYSDYELHSFALDNGERFSSYVLKEEQLLCSAKCRFLAKLLPELKIAGSRPLIFSQWVVVLDILEWLLQTLKLPYVRLDGNTAVADRLTTVDLFNNKENGVFAFLLSTRAGGQGLNLTGADTVILHDVDFNPQVDRQAEDRCHRLGQTRPVTVIRLVTEGTVDEGIHALAERKLRLDAAVLDGITASTAQAKAYEKAAMGKLLESVIAEEAKENSEEKSLPPSSDAKQASPQKDENWAGKEAGLLSGGAEAGGAARKDILAGGRGKAVVRDTPSCGASLGTSEERSTSATEPEQREGSTPVVDLTSPSPSRFA